MRKPKPGRKKVKGLTHKQRVYVQTKILTGSKSEALKAAGYRPKGNTVEESVVVQQALAEYKQRMDKKFMDKADEVANMLLEVIYNPDTPASAKVTAIKDWLDRAGLKPVDKQEVDDKRVIDTSSRLSRELIDKLNTLPKESGEE